MLKTVPQSAARRKRIDVRGIVQGVGFRPFVFRLATELRVSGFVRNTSEGALIEVEGTRAALERFLSEIVAEKPPLAQIEDVAVSELAPSGETGFCIEDSLDEAGKFALISPDVGTCENCWQDFSNPRNRRFGYPFTNCTNCGPRYTIIRDIPYDRATTTMESFQMCAACQAEFDDPLSRRFHAQPNACPNCGPGLALVKSEDFVPGEDLNYVSRDSNKNVIRNVRQSLGEGAIVAIKGLGGFHLACDAENDAAVRRLRERKRRRDKPFALMAPDIAAIESLCLLSETDRKSLLSTRRPIVILPRNNGTKISESVAPGNNTLGFMLPCSPLQYMLFRGVPDEAPFFRALVMTSGNLSEEPIVSRNEEAQRLGSVADWLVLHNRNIQTRVDDSVVRTFDGVERTIRRSRGQAPYPIDMGVDVSEILACGAEMKNTFCLTKGHYGFLSQHMGDLENYETLLFFQETVEHMKKLFRVEPRVIAHDLHPLYMSTKFAREIEGAQKIGVQHHHAHIASCMTENRIRDKVIGVALDGTGYGTDGQIWGGEFLIADLAGFERRAHFRYVAMPGADAAVRQPWRMALSYLVDTFGSERIPLQLPSLSGVPTTERALVQTIIERRVNTVNTSSCGRLFDAVASLIGLQQEITFEGQAAMALEMAAVEGISERYFFEIGVTDPWQIDMRPAIKTIVSDMANGVLAGTISAKFHNTVAAAILETCGRLRECEGLNRVCLSGGTFQNIYLLNRTAADLRRCGFDLYLHAKVPPNDGGISLGQAAIVNELLRRGH